jgi:hypothetical protein
LPLESDFFEDFFEDLFDFAFFDDFFFDILSWSDLSMLPLDEDDELPDLSVELDCEKAGAAANANTAAIRTARVRIMGTPDWG